MLDNISKFCTSIICTIMMVIIIELIAPEGKSKKYISFICGIVVTITLIEPLTNLMNIDINEIIASSEKEYNDFKCDENLYISSVKKTYEEFLINDIVLRLKENGYDVYDVKVEYDKETFKPTEMYMSMKSSDGYVQPIKIEVSSSKNSYRR